MLVSCLQIQYLDSELQAAAAALRQQQTQHAAAERELRLQIQQLQVGRSWQCIALLDQCRILQLLHGAAVVAIALRCT